MVELLLDRGASIEATNEHKNTPLHIAAKGCQPSVVKILLDRGASIRATNKYGHTPFYLARRSGHIGAVRLFNKNATEERVHKNDVLYNKLVARCLESERTQK